MGERRRKDRNLFEVERRSGGALSVFIIKPVVWEEGVLSSPGTDLQRIYTKAEFKFGSRTKQLSGETRAWGSVGGNQMAGRGMGLFSVFQSYLARKKPQTAPSLFPPSFQLPPSAPSPLPSLPSQSRTLAIGWAGLAPQCPPVACTRSAFWI